MTTEDKRRKPPSEKVLKVLQEGRLKGLETRRMRAELKKTSKAEEKEALKKAYEERVLKKKTTETTDVVEETDKEIYPVNNKPSKESNDDDGDSEYEDEPVVVPKPNAKATAKTMKETNYKQEYYKIKMMKLQEQEQQQNFMQSYTQLPPQQHMADIARNQIQSKIDKEVLARVYREMFGG